MEWEWVEPIKVFREARGIPGCVFLDSGGAIGPLSRWSALAVRPLEVIEARVGEGLAAGTSLCDPFERLGALHRRWRQRARLSADGGDIVEEPRSDESDLPAFTGGVVSLLGYDAGRVVERLPAIAQDDPSLPDLWAAVYDGAIVFDRLLRRLYATS